MFVVQELIIIAPPSFLFDESAGGCGDMCLQGAQSDSIYGRLTLKPSIATTLPQTPNLNPSALCQSRIRPYLDLSALFALHY